jgi:hypothetical protein
MDSDLQVVAADIGNSFLYGKNREQTMIKAGPEFGPLQGKLLIVEGRWYGHKAAATVCHSHLSAHLRHLGFVPAKRIWICGSRRGRTETMNISLPRWTISLLLARIQWKLKETYILKGIVEPE